MRYWIQLMIHVPNYMEIIEIFINFANDELKNVYIVRIYEMLVQRQLHAITNRLSVTLDRKCEITIAKWKRKVDRIRWWATQACGE